MSNLAPALADQISVRPVLMDHVEARQLWFATNTHDILHRVATKGFWREDQFGIDWASLEAQAACVALLAKAPKPSHSLFGFDYVTATLRPSGEAAGD